MNNLNSIVDPQNVNEAKSELETLGSGLQGQTSIEEHRKNTMLQNIKFLSEENPKWINKLMLSKENKALLKAYGQKQLEAANIALGEQNKSLAAICEGQTRFVKEVVNTLLLTGRSGMKSAAAAIFRENELAMQATLTKISSEFYTLVDYKYRDAEPRLPFIQKQIMREIDLMMKKWEEDYISLQNDFSTILQEKV